MRCITLYLLLALTFATLPSCESKSSDGQPTSAATATQPNFIFILADDLGYGDIDFGDFAIDSACVAVPTPNIHRMAAEGMRFTDFYVASPVCSQARASFLTGCYPTRLGFGDHVDHGWGVMGSNVCYGLNPAEVTIAEALKSRGYATSVIGKWHLGHQPEFLPQQQGFDEYWGPPFRSRRLDTAELWHDDAPADTVLQDALTDLYTEKAIEFITNNRDRPFFLYLAHSMPHTPLAVPDRFLGQSPRGLYGDAIMHLDWSTGHIMQALRDLGLADNTVVVFTSDNGADLNYGGCNAPFVGGKASLNEGGVRVPFIVWWPGTVPANQVRNGIIASMDLFPTLVSLASPGDAPPVENEALDGVDFSRVFKDELDEPWPRQSFYYYHGKDLKAVRTDQWKLTFYVQDPDSLHEQMQLFFRLTDLSRDPTESVNMSQGDRGVAVRMHMLADRMRRDLGDGLTHSPGTRRRQLAIAEPCNTYLFSDEAGDE